MEDANLLLLLAARSGSLEKMQQALDAGADVNAVEWDGTTPLMRCILNDFEKGVVLLLSKGADPNRANRYGTTPLMLACQKDTNDLAHVLSQAGADINLADPDGWTPLMRAIVAGKDQVAIYLVQVGAHVGAVNSKGQSAQDLLQAQGKLALGDALRSAAAMQTLLDEESEPGPSAA